MSLIVTAIDGQGSYTASNGVTVSSSGVGADAFYSVQSDFFKNEGILQSVDSFEVTEDSPQGLSVVVSTGTAITENDNFSEHSQTPKFFRVDNTTNITAAINANNSGNPRVDKVSLLRDTGAIPNDAGDNIYSITVSEGTAAASPSAPATPSHALPLANVTVTSGDSTIAQSDISDLRVYAEINNLNDGWTSIGSGAAYQSTDTVRFENINLTSLFSVGDGLKFDQPTDGTKYFYIVGLSFTGGNTDITIEAGDDYDLDNEAITNFHYTKNPDNAVGFPSFFSYTPTITAAGSMTVSSTSINDAYFHMEGDYAEIFYNITFTLGGTAENTVYATLPIEATNNFRRFGGYIVDNGNTAGSVIFTNGTTQFAHRRYDAADWGTGSTSAIYASSFTYQVM